jgi:SAM-dependent methyltransferase
MNKIVEEFWKTRKEYPPITCNFQRRYLDLGIILKHIDDAKSILDLGCGEGQILLILRELSGIKEYYGYDLSSVFINNLIKRWGKYPGLEARVLNFIKDNNLPKTDVCICMGAMLYVFDDDDLKYMLSNIKSKTFICRVPCNLESDRLEINKFSEEYREKYAAVYRTIPEYIFLLTNFFNIKATGRCYPDEIESEYGSKQFFFVCER